MDPLLTSLSTTAIAQLTKVFLDRLEPLLTDAVVRKVLPHLKTFEPYLRRTLKKCNSVRVLADRDRVYALSTVYVQGRYRSGTNEVGDQELCASLREGNKLVVQGFGGIGKSILMKHLWLTAFAEPAGKVPVFLELRRLNDVTSPDLRSYIATVISSRDEPMSVAAVNTLGTAGRFCFLLDGFDELDETCRSDIERQILDMAYDFPDCGMAVSSRRDDRFLSWEQFSSYEALPFDKAAISEVISKIEFDPEVKSKFLSQVVDKQFDQHRSFLSTPLLAIMMLMTYRQFADVPEKLHIFYRYAFQTLFSLHDASKEAFKRKRKTRLDEEEFSRLFSIVCILSYLDGNISFSITQAKKYVDKAKSRVSFKVNSSDFIDDAVDSVNLLFKEGQNLSFVHRSFQEYFSAYAMINVFFEDISRIVAKIMPRPSDGVLSMAYEMNPDLMESKYFLPEYEKYKTQISDFLRPYEVITDYFSKFGCNWLVMFTLPKQGRGNVSLSMIIPGTEFYGIINTVRQLFVSEMAAEIGAPDALVKLSGKLRAEIGKVVAQVRNPIVGASFQMVLASFSEGKGGDLEIQEVQASSEEGSEERSPSSITFRSAAITKHFEQWAVRNKAECVFAEKKLKEMAKRQRARAKALEDFL